MAATENFNSIFSSFFLDQEFYLFIFPIRLIIYVLWVILILIKFKLKVGGREGGKRTKDFPIFFSLLINQIRGGCFTCES